MPGAITLSIKVITLTIKVITPFMPVHVPSTNMAERIYDYTATEMLSLLWGVYRYLGDH